MGAFKIYHDPYVTCDEDRYLSQCASDAAGILCQHWNIKKIFITQNLKWFWKDDGRFIILFHAIYMIGQAWLQRKGLLLLRFIRRKIVWRHKKYINNFLYVENIVTLLKNKNKLTNKLKSIIRYSRHLFDFMITLEVCIYLNDAFLIWTKLALFTDHLAWVETLYCVLPNKSSFTLNIKDRIKIT